MSRDLREDDDGCQISWNQMYENTDDVQVNDV